VIPADDLHIEVWPPRKGGQQVGSMPNGVKITHLRSRLVAICENQRSQHRNREIAMDMIVSALTNPAYRDS
jgi:peptide chain release factor 2